MADPELVPEAILDQGGLKVSKSPWGAGRRDRRLNWVTQQSTAAILATSAGSTSSTSRRVLHRHAELVAAGDPPYGSG